MSLTPITNESSGSNAHWLEKVLRPIIPLGIGTAIFIFWGKIVPFVVDTLQNTLLAIIYAVILLGTTVFVVRNPTFVWMMYKTFCRKITEFFVKLDPISVMDRHVDLLKRKLKNLNLTITFLTGKKIELEREIETLNANIEEYKKNGISAAKLGDKLAFAEYGTKLQTDQETVNMFMPILEKMKLNLTSLEELSENWGFSIKTLSYTIDRKKKEFVMLKATAKALNQAKEFANGDTESRRLYDMSVTALEQSVSQKIAAIEKFEKDSKTMMSQIRINKQTRTDEGIKALEEHLRNQSSNLKLPDFTKFSPTFTKLEAETIPFQQVKKFNL